MTTLNPMLAPARVSATKRTAAAGPRAARMIWARRRRPIFVPARLVVILSLLALTTATAVLVGLAVLALGLVQSIAITVTRLVEAVAWRYRHRRLSAPARHHADAERRAAERLRQLRSETTTATAPRPAPAVEAAGWSQPTGQLPPWETPPPAIAPATAAQRPVVMTAPHYVQVPAPRHARRAASSGFWSSPAGLSLGFKLLVLWGLLYVGLIGCFVTVVADHNTPDATVTQEATP